MKYLLHLFAFINAYLVNYEAKVDVMYIMYMSKNDSRVDLTL